MFFVVTCNLMFEAHKEGGERERKRERVKEEERET